MNKTRLMTVVAAAALAVACGGQNAPADQTAPAATGAPAAAGQPAPESASGPTAVATPAPADSAPAPTTRTPARTARAPVPTFGASEPAPRATGTARPAPAPSRPTFAEISVPAGTELLLDLDTPLSTETAKIEDPVRATLRQAVVIDGRTVLPSGALLVGTVTDAERPGRVKGRARLGIRFTEIRVRNDSIRLSAAPISIEGEASKGEDATKIGVGAGVGAAIGAIAGGKGGAAKGAAIGGAAGTGAVMATRGKELELARGANLTTRLVDALRVEVPIR